MAKVSLNKVTPIKKIDNVTIVINGENIEVKQYLNGSELTGLLNEVMNLTFDVDGFVSPLRFELYSKVFLIKYYTNINITDTMIDNIEKTYELLQINNIFDSVFEAIPREEINKTRELLCDTMKKIQEYNTSFVGWMRTAANDQAATEMNLENVMKEITNNENFNVVKEVVQNLN